MKDGVVPILFAFALLSVGVAGQVAGGGGDAAKNAVSAFEATGRSAAARGLQEGMSSVLVRAVQKGRAIKTPAPKDSGSSRQQIRNSRPAPMLQASPSVSNPLIFRPTGSSDYTLYLADTIGTNETEKKYLSELFEATRKAFEKEVAAKGRSNDLSAAFTFFIATTVTVYNDAPEPSDAAVDKLWDGMSTTLGGMPEASKLSDIEKQQMYETLVSLSGLALAGYAESKNSGNAETLLLYRALAGAMIQSVLKTDPSKLKFTPDGLTISS